MTTQLKLTGVEDAQIIKNLWPLYVHETSEFDEDGVLPNRHGLLDDRDDVTTFAEAGESMNAWWAEPGLLMPYLILADGVPAGFNLVSAGQRIPKEIDADFVVHEFFVLHPFRGLGVAGRAAALGFDAHLGRWEVVTYAGHARAIAFWKRVIYRYTRGAFTQQELDHQWGRKMVFRFDNGERPAT